MSDFRIRLHSLLRISTLICIFFNHLVNCEDKWKYNLEHNSSVSVKVTNFQTVFVALEKSFSPSGQCDGTCPDLGKAKVFCKTNDNKCLSKIHPECDNNPTSCKTFKPPCPVQDLQCFAGGMKSTACSSDDENKMYDWVSLDENIFGAKDKDAECDQVSTEFTGTDEIIGGKSQKCEICLCQCMEPILIQGNTSSVRKFSMNEAVSNVKDNRVIVGIKFEQVVDEIHLMIADAVSLPGSKVDATTITWITPKTADPTKPEGTRRLSKTLKTFHMEDLKAPEGSVVTGVKFIEKPKNLKAAVGLEQEMYIGIAIQTTHVDPKTGKLDASSSTWVDGPSTSKTTQYKYEDPDSPVKVEANGVSEVDSVNDQFIDFQVSSYKKDAGQTVIPFFESAKVVTELAIRGVGVFHSRKPGFGGFLSAKILPCGE